MVRQCYPILQNKKGRFLDVDLCKVVPLATEHGGTQTGSLYCIAVLLLGKIPSPLRRILLLLLFHMNSLLCESGFLLTLDITPETNSVIKDS